MLSNRNNILVDGYTQRNNILDSKMVKIETLDFGTSFEDLHSLEHYCFTESSPIQVWYFNTFSSRMKTRSHVNYLKLRRLTFIT